MKHFLVYNCNFCNSQNIRLDVLKTTINTYKSYYNQIFYWQAFTQCSNCKKGMILHLESDKKKIDDDIYLDHREKKEISLVVDLCTLSYTNINDHVFIKGLITPPLKQQNVCPIHVPEEIKNIFDEATKCLSMDCFVASGSMFRLCLDLVTKNLLEKWLEENQASEQQPNKDQRNKLANRIDFLINQDKIPKRLKELAHCIRHDGNDSAHDGNTGEDEALDCLDFTEALLKEVYTFPAQIQEAEKRRLERREKS
ncbi:DUF4145 domain-containing protein [Acinetobacter schindleri]|uniref:DUF4145 domain-containing protein n=1 Tax=Acinetobacter schindleri TaxID=108981 RepID=UPI002898DE40|nr:DUF4145 domain-containing protein [Acinetobacter schindleri]